jgi:pimeloyl-ACP methyl ester carboxylesterase/DNA-binding CsgD family transcriptional regulator
MAVASDRQPVGAGTQQIRFCQTPDGIRIAHARHGNGPPLLVVACWLSHLQYDWQSPVWRHFLEDLGEFTTLIRYDLRGHGLSDWDVDDFSFEAHMSDLEAVIEANGYERLALMGMSGYGPLAMAYAARHPERVTRLVLYGSRPGVLPNSGPDADDEEAAWVAMLRAGWARPDPTFRRVFTQGFIPGATEEQMVWFDNLQRMSTSTANAIAARAERLQFDVGDELGDIRAPTLMLQAQDDRLIPFDAARETARRIPNARLVPLQSRNHVLLEDEPAWDVLVSELRSFMAADRELFEPSEDTAALRTLTAREREILRLAEQQTNDEIARALNLSPRTVERHLSNAYLKLNLSGKTARTAAVGMLLRSRQD